MAVIATVIAIPLIAVTTFFYGLNEGKIRVIDWIVLFMVLGVYYLFIRWGWRNYRQRKIEQREAQSQQ